MVAESRTQQIKDPFAQTVSSGRGSPEAGKFSLFDEAGYSVKPSRIKGHARNHVKVNDYAVWVRVPESPQ